MGNKLDANDVQSAVEDYTGLSWVVEVDTDDCIVLSRASYRYEFENKGGAWQLNIYDENKSETEPQWSLSPVPTGDVLDDISAFTPKELQRH